TADKLCQEAVRPARATTGMVANLDLLLAAIRCGRSMTVLARTSAGASEVQVRLVAGEEGDDGFWAQVERQHVDLIDRLIAVEAMVQGGISVGDVNVLFQSALIQRRRRLGQKQQVQFYWPVKLQVVERRTREREPVPEATPLTAPPVPDSPPPVNRRPPSSPLCHSTPPGG